MHEAEPVLYWRVKRDGVWRFEKANVIIGKLVDEFDIFGARHCMLSLPKAPEVNVNESEH